MKSKNLLIFHFLFSSVLCAQGWEKVYQNVSLDWQPGIQKIAFTSDSAYVLIGYGYLKSSQFVQTCMIKTNALGEIIWSKLIVDTSGIKPSGVIETQDGFFIWGTRYSPYENFLSKLDFNGNLLWTKSYNGAFRLDMILKTEGGFVLMGKKTGNERGLYLSKINNEGEIFWNKTFWYDNFNPCGIAACENNEFIILGSGGINNLGNKEDCYIMKFDSSGHLLWNKSFGYLSYFSPYVIKSLSDGGFIIAGAILMKIDKDGNLIWVKESNSGRFFKDIYQTPDCGFVAVTGKDWWYGMQGILIYKINSEGSIEWITNIGGKNNDPFTINSSPDGGFIITGIHKDVAQNINGLYLVKTDSMGQSGCNDASENLEFNLLQSTLCVITSHIILDSTDTNYNHIILSSDTISINVFDPCCYAKPEISHNSGLCSGDTIHYWGNGAPQLQWCTGETTNHIETTDTIVSLTVTNTCGSFTDTLIVTPDPVPFISYSLSKQTICNPDSTLLTITGSALYYNIVAQCGWQCIKKMNDTTYYLKPTSTSTFTITGKFVNDYDACSNKQTFTIYVIPDKPLISQLGDTLFSSSPFNNQWFFDGNSIAGAVEAQLIMNQAGDYSVQVSDSACSNISDVFPYVPDTLLYSRIAWQKIIDIKLQYQITSFCPMDEGEFIIGTNFIADGSTVFQENEDLALIKIDRAGEVLWSKMYGGSGNDRIYSVKKVENGFVGVGSTTSFGNGNKDVYVLRFDNNGLLLWSKTYGDWNDQEGFSIEPTSDGGFIIGGYSTDPDYFSLDSDLDIEDNNDLYLVKISSAGNLIWANTYDISTSEASFEARETADGNYVGAGISHEAFNSRGYILATNQNGNLLWSKTSSDVNSIASFKVTSDTGFLVYSNDYDGSVLQKLDENGNVVWSKKMYSVYHGTSLTITKDGIVLTGNSSLTITDMNGEFLWSNNFRSDYKYNFSDFAQLEDGSFMLVGAVDTSGSWGPWQISIINTDSTGQTNCSKSVFPVCTNELYSMAPCLTVVSPLGAVKSAATNSYEGILKSGTLCRSASYVPTPKDTLKNIFFNIYPNPSDGKINIVAAPSAGNIFVSVFDVTGRCILKQNAYTSFLQINLGENAKGLFLLEIHSEQNRVTRKIVLN